MRTLFPLAPLSLTVFLASLTYDMAILRNLTDKTVLFFTLTVHVFLLALLAEAIGLITKKMALDGLQTRGVVGRGEDSDASIAGPAVAATQAMAGLPAESESRPTKAA
jgi:hypothetical protein